MRGSLLVLKTNCMGQLPSLCYNHNTLTTLRERFPHLVPYCKCEVMTPSQMFWGLSVYCGCKMNWAAASLDVLSNYSSSNHCLFSLYATMVITLCLKQPTCFTECKVAAAITQFAGGSKSTWVLITQKKDPAWESNRTVSMGKYHLSSAPMLEL